MITLPEALHPIMTKGKKIELDEEYFVSDYIRERMSRRKVTGSIRAFRVLYQFRDIIAKEIGDHRQTKKFAIQNIDNLNWTKWYVGTAVPTGPPFGADWDFVFSIEYPVNLEAKVASKNMGICEVDEIKSVKYVVEFTAMDYRASPPRLEIRGKVPLPCYVDYLIAAGPDRRLYERSQLNMTIELAPMAREWIDIFDTILSDLKRYKRECQEMQYRIKTIKKKLRKC